MPVERGVALDFGEIAGWDPERPGLLAGHLAVPSSSSEVCSYLPGHGTLRCHPPSASDILKIPLQSLRPERTQNSAMFWGQFQPWEERHVDK